MSDVVDRLSYRIDRRDVLTSVGDGWAAFARANGAPHLAEQVVGRSLWDFVCGDTTRQVYRDLLVRVRTGRTVSFPYRCDAPAVRRFMRMTMTPGPGHHVTFDSDTLGEESRVPPAVLLAASVHSDVHLPVCSWCKRVSVDDRWVEVEEAVERLGLFADAPPPVLTHSICPDCLARLTAAQEQA